MTKLTLKRFALSLYYPKLINQRLDFFDKRFPLYIFPLNDIYALAVLVTMLPFCEMDGETINHQSYYCSHDRIFGINLKLIRLYVCISMYLLTSVCMCAYMCVYICFLCMQMHIQTFCLKKTQILFIKCKTDNNKYISFSPWLYQIFLKNPIKFITLDTWNQQSISYRSEIYIIIILYSLAFSWKKYDNT